MISDLVGRVSHFNFYCSNDTFLGTHYAHEFLEASDPSLTTPMHTDRRKSIGYGVKVICGG